VRVAILAIDEVAAVAVARRHRRDRQWTAMLYLLTFTALRWAEASALRWEALDPEHGVIRVNRGQYKARSPT